VSRRLKAAFMELRILPVLLWAGASVTIASAVAAFETGTFEPAPFVFLLLAAAVTQGYPTHIVNDIEDHRSGADRGSGPSGGSKVLQAGLATVADLSAWFVAASLFLLVLETWMAARYGWPVLLLGGTGYLAGLLYTLPPARFAYRPFLGEWLSGFPGILAAFLGAYFVQTGTVSRVVLGAAAGYGLFANGLLVHFHLLDAERDRNARPPKRTTVVHLGPRGSKRYATLLFAGSGLVFTGLGVVSHPAFGVLAANSLLALAAHGRTDPSRPASILANGRRITYVSLALVFGFAVLVRPYFAALAVPLLLSLLAHRRFGRLHWRPSTSSSLAPAPPAR
jgi:1,4-dihydroxy-2-naphthoate octaprenyltransferase